MIEQLPNDVQVYSAWSRPIHASIALVQSENNMVFSLCNALQDALSRVDALKMRAAQIAEKNLPIDVPSGDVIEALQAALKELCDLIGEL